MSNSLNNLDPYDSNLTDVQKEQIFQRCKSDPLYFETKVIRTNKDESIDLSTLADQVVNTETARQDISVMQGLLHHPEMKPGLPNEVDYNELLSELNINEEHRKPLTNLDRVKHLLISTRTVEGTHTTIYFLWINEVPAGMIEVCSGEDWKEVYYDVINDVNWGKLLVINGFSMNAIASLYVTAAFDLKIYVNVEMLDPNLTIGDYEPYEDYGPQWDVEGFRF